MKPEGLTDTTLQLSDQSWEAGRILTY